MSRIYNDPLGGDASSVGSQIRTDVYKKKALIEARKEQFFSQLADVTSMPKHMGKKIKKFHYLPLLDDLNINDQGIDAAGVAILTTERFVTFPRSVLFVADADVVAATAAINDDMDASYVAAVAGAAGSAVAAGGPAAHATITLDVSKGLTFKYSTVTKSDLIMTYDLGASVQQGSGNLYGSSKDVGSITGKLPALSETGGRVNRIGFKRVEIEGTIEKVGFFDEYTQESMDFDTDEELMMHINREMVMGANELTEDALQIDLLNAAGVIRYPGTATSMYTMSGELAATNAATAIVTYDDFMRLSIDLDENRTPKNTKMITGTRLVDSKIIDAARYMYCGTEMLPTLKNMVDNFGNPAFVPAAKYAAGGTLAVGEVGSIDQFRIIVVPEIMHWTGAGGPVTDNLSLARETDGQYDVFPMLVVGSESFSTIGFQTDGKTVKFKIYHKAPGEATADKSDPFGETGFMSIKWYYGTLILRSERIALLPSLAVA